MPKIIIHTNIKDADISPDFEEKVALKVSEVINYPLELIHVCVTYGDRMIHNGSRAPMAFVDIDTANKFSEEANPGYTVKFQEFFTKELNIPASRTKKMPKIIIHTNIKDADIPEDFEEKVAQIISDVVGYPLEIIYVSVTCGDRMIHNGSRDPMAFVNIDTANKFNAEVNPGYTVKFQEFFTNALKIPASRLVLHYQATQVWDYGVHRTAPEYKHPEYYSK